MNKHKNSSDICPCLTYDDAQNAIEWLCHVFGFKKRLVVMGDGSRVEHSELSFGNGVIMVSSPKQEDNRISQKNLSGIGQMLSIYVANPDKHYKNSIAEGVQIIRELKTEDYGATGYMAVDLEGHVWYFGNYRPGEFWEH
jgi:uncharacterized glyoxalase superfamily protein PhnB